MKVAVIGAGIFGSTIALRLDQEHEVDLYDAAPDIMQSASAINQFRLHRGYHYPRSDDTVSALRRSEPRFRAEYPEAVLDDVNHYYAIARDCSLTQPAQFLAFCDRSGLPYEEAWPPFVNRRNLSLCVKVLEASIDPVALRQVVWRRLQASHVGIHLGRRVTLPELRHDIVVVATYASMNALLPEDDQTKYQFELCEKVMVRLPEALHGQSLVVMDGPFGCFDPYGHTGTFVLGHVDLAIHTRDIAAYHPAVPAWYDGLLNRPPTRRLMFSHAPAIIQALSVFVPEMRQAEYLGSLYTVRTVLPFMEATDGRPTVVNRLNDRVITAFGGKIPDCVAAAEWVSLMVQQGSIA